MLSSSSSSRGSIISFVNIVMMVIASRLITRQSRVVGRPLFSSSCFASAFSTNNNRSRNVKRIQHHPFRIITEMNTPLLLHTFPSRPSQHNSYSTHHYHHHHRRLFFSSTPKNMVQDDNNAETNTNSFFAPTDQYPNFESIGITSSILLQRISENLKLERPSAVQASTFKELSGDKIKNNVIMGAETGSGVCIFLLFLNSIICLFSYF